MSESVAARVAKLKKLSADELQVEWEKVFGRPTRQRHRVYLWKRPARKLQEDQLPQMAAEEEAKVAEFRDIIRQLPPDRWFPSKWKGKPRAKVSVSDSRTPPPGSVISRQYHGQEIAVKVLDDGFEYEGQVFRSLSAIAKEVTGTVWNGPAFFGLRKGVRK